MALPAFLENLHINDDIIEWKRWTKGDKICEKFPLDEWHKIVFDKNSDDEWEQYLSDYSGYVCCFILYRLSVHEPIAFCYLLLGDR